MKNIALFIHIIFLGVISISAQISFQAIPQKREIGIDEPIRIQFILSIKGKDVREISNIKLPTFENTQVIGKQVIQNQSYEYGASTIEFGNEISLKAVKPCNIKIGSATVTVNGKVYSTKPFIIKVSGHVSNQEEKGFPSNVGDTFLSFKISDKTPYQNEGVVAQLKFYTKRLELLNSMTNLAPPNFQGLFVQPIKERNNTYEQEIINGEGYFSRVICSYVLFPSKPGELTINPFTLTLTVPSGFFDEQEVYIKSAPVNLQVKKLPENPPKDFYGLVGDYKINITPSKKQLKEEESTTISVEVSGKGNIGLLKAPSLIVPEGIESFTPKDKMESKPGFEGVEGKIKTSTVLVPHQKGKFIIRVNSLSFFDPKTETYKKISPELFILTVTGDSLKGLKDTVNLSKNKNIKSPLSFIPTLKDKEAISDVLSGEKNISYGLLVVIVLVLVVIITLSIIYFIFIKKRKSKNKKEEVKNTIIESVAKVNKFKTDTIKEVKKDNLSSILFKLKKISENNENKTEFYNLMEALLQKAVRENLNIKEEEFITSSEIEEKLANKFGDEFSDNYKELLLKSQIERYSNLTEEDSLTEIYKNVENFVNKLI